MMQSWCSSVRSISTLEHLQTRLEVAETQDATYYSTAEILEVIPYPQILELLKRGQLTG